MNIIIFLTLSFLAFTNTSFSVEKDCASQFLGSLDKGPFEIIPSGRESREDLELFKDVIDDYIRPGGLAERLNLTHPAHKMIFTTPELINILAILNRSAVGHWIDGGQLATSNSGDSVLEFVTGGCQTCKSFYQDTTNPIQQISIMYHVFGHLHVAAHSIIRIVRGGDQMTASLQLEKLMRETIQSGVDPDEVAYWYQQLSSLPMLQDIALGAFESLESFAPLTSFDKNKRRISFPKHPTLSVLQALLANLPSTAPLWKVEMAAVFEQMNRYIGSVPPQIILNEGFATLMMYVAPSHSKYITSEHLLKYAQLLAGVLGNGEVMPGSPYWLGLEAWRAERLRFNAQPSIRALSVIEQDAAFIKHGTTMIETMDDREFLRTTLDERFVRKHKLLLFAQAPDIDPSVPGRRAEDNAQVIVESTDPREVIEALIDQFGDKRNLKPQIELTSLEAYGGHGITLRQINFKNYPLKLRSTAQTLFVIARMMEKTLSLETRFFVNEKILPVRIEVEPYGKAKVFIQANGEETFDKELSKKSQTAIDWYLEDNAGMLNEQLTEAENKRFTSLAVQVIDNNLKPVMGFISHAPTAAHALDEFAKMLKTRMTRAFKLIREGKLKLRSTKTGFAFKPLPLVPEFNFDLKVINKLQRNGTLQTSPFKGLTVGYLKGGLAGQQLLDIGSGDSGKGDRKWAKLNEEEDSDEPDEDDGSDPKSGEEDPGNGRGGDNAKPYEVVITLEEFQEILDLELPNPKPRESGEATAPDQTRDGGVRRSHGEILWSRMMGPIMAKGLMMLEDRDKKSQGEKYKKQKYTTNEIMKEGLKWVTPEDYIVVNREPSKRPQSRAIFVLIMDQSGSMHGMPQEVVKKLYRNMMVMLKKKYTDLEVVHIGFNNSIALILTEEQFFGNHLDGGDSYVLGWNKGIEVLSDEKYRDFDKYGILAGDFQSMSGSNVDDAMYNFSEMLNYGAVIQTVVNGDVANPMLIDPVKKLAAESQWFDFGALGKDEMSQLDLLKNFFGKNKPNKNKK